MAVAIMLGIAVQLYAVRLHYFSNTPYYSEAQKIAFYLSAGGGLSNVKALNWFSKENTVLDVTGDINQDRISELLLSQGYQLSRDNGHGETVWRKIGEKYYYVVVQNNLLVISIGSRNYDEIYHFTASYQ